MAKNKSGFLTHHLTCFTDVCQYLIYGRSARKYIMFDNAGIYNRYESCHNAGSSGELARILGIARQSTNDWKNGKSKVPWWRLKLLVDSQGISWDWLLVGKGEKYANIRNAGRFRGFDIKGVNSRYLALFPANLSQIELAKKNNVSQVTVHKWRQGMEQVSWKKLLAATRDFGVTWNWLLNGDCEKGSKN